MFGIAWYYVQMPWKVAIFHIQNAIKTTFMKGITYRDYPTLFKVVFHTEVVCQKIQHVPLVMWVTFSKKYCVTWIFFLFFLFFLFLFFFFCKKLQEVARNLQEVND